MYRRKRIITSSEQIREHRATISKTVKTNATAHDKNTTALDTFAKARGIIGTTTGVDASGSQPDAEEKDPKATAKKDDQDENEGDGDGDAEGESSLAMMETGRRLMVMRLVVSRLSRRRSHRRTRSTVLPVS